MENKPFVRCTPEEAGISAAAVERFMRALAGMDITMHGVMMLHNSKCLYEGYWKPIDESFMHRLYSCSKSFVSVAVGLAVQKGLLKLTDRCVDFFPERLTGNEHPYLKMMTVRDCLRMSTCWTNGSNYSPKDHDWISTFFADEVSHVPGAVFNYCTSGTTMLCCILKRVTGMSLTEFLRPVFDEIGIAKEAFCVQAPEGNGEYVEWGGSGMVMTMRDFAKFADLCMHYGAYEGKRLLPEEYMREATSSQIDNSMDSSDPYLDRGYGYQFWMVPDGGFAFDGMGGQFAICFPEKGFILMTTGYEELKSSRRREIFDALYRDILPALGSDPLPADPAANASLAAFTETLTVPCARGLKNPAVVDDIDGKWYRMGPNEMGLYSSCFTFHDGVCTWEYENRTGYHVIELGLGHNIDGEFPEKYCAVKIDTRAAKGYRCLSSAAFVSPDTLRMEFRVADTYLAQLFINVCFKNDTVTFHGTKHAEWFMDEYIGYASGELA